MRLQSGFLWALFLLVSACANQVGGPPPGFCRTDSDCPSGTCGPNATCIGGAANADGGAGTGDGGFQHSDGGGSGIDGGGVMRDGGGSGSDGGVAGDDGGVAGGDGGTVTGGADNCDPTMVPRSQCHDPNSRRPCGCSTGTCVQGYQICMGEFYGPCMNAIGPAPEECDGRDHNCDGIPNNRPGGCDCQNGDTRPCFNDPNSAAFEGMGTCHAGTQTCTDGHWGSCQGSVEPQPGNCNLASCAGGPNPGCTCIIGNTQSCYDGPAGTAGKGICHAGMQACIASSPSGSMWGPCQGEQVPEDEKCDGLDHNCDGIPNNPPGGCVCTMGQSQSCYSGPAGSLTVDGGTCHAGTQPCVLSDGGINSWGACTGEVVPVPGDCDHPSCTGPNNPNDGCACINTRTQSCYTGPAGTQGNGICVGGNQTCVGGAWGTCAGQVTPDTQDSCAPGNATQANYSQFTTYDRNCNGLLDRRNPVATPTASAKDRFNSVIPPANLVFPPPAGFAYAVHVPPLATVTLMGGATDLDGAGSFSYQWRLLSAPQNNTAGISGAPGGTPNDISTQQNPTLFAQLAGEYDIGVRAIDSTGCLSDEVKVQMLVVPEAGIHLELSWDEPLDMDIQVTNGDSTPFSLTVGSANNCFWGHLNASWNGVSCTLKIDDLIGCNPEDIQLTGTPANGSTYGVYAHVFCNHRGHLRAVTTNGYACYETNYTNSVTATLNAYINGSPAASISRSLTNGAVWKIATLTYNAGSWNITRDDQLQTSIQECDNTSGEATCVCNDPSMEVSSNDLYCGPTGAACRQKYP
jgi:hypothetical protein